MATYDVTILDSLPVAYWKLQESSITAGLDPIVDAGPNAIAGLADTDLTTTASTGPLIGIDDRSISFDGIDDCIDLTSNALLTNMFDAGGAVEFWFHAGNQTGTIVSKINETSSFGWEVSVSSAAGGLAQLEFRAEFSTTHGAWQTQESPTQGFWHHVYIVYDADAVGNDPTVYVDGVSAPLAETSTPVGTRATDSGLALKVACRDTGVPTYYLGRVAYLSVYSTAQASWRARNHYEAGRPGLAAKMFPIAEPALFVPFAMASGSEPDAVGTGKVFALVGAPTQGVETPVHGWDDTGASLVTAQAFVSSQSGAYRSGDNTGTLCFWARASGAAVSQTDYVFEYGDTAGTNHFRITLESDGTEHQRRLHLSVFDGIVDQDAQTGYVIPADQWMFMAVASDGAGYDLWLNDTKIVSASGNGAWFADLSLAAEHVQVGRLGPSTYSDGFDVSSLALFSSNLSDADVKSVYRAGLRSPYAAGILDAPKVHLPLDEPVGSTLVRNISGVSVGAPGSATSWNTTVAGTPVFREEGPGGGGTGVHLDGVANFLTFEAQASHFAFPYTTSMDFAFTCWVKFDDHTALFQQYLFGNSIAAVTKGFGLWYDNTGGNKRVRFILADGTVAIAEINAGVNDITDNGWHHIAVRGDDANAYLYVDGAFRRSVALGTATTGNPDNQHLFIGRTSLGTWFLDGVLADVRCYDADLGAGGIKKEYEAGRSFYAATVLALAPFAFYRHDEASGTTMADSAGSARDGTYVGGPGLTEPGLPPVEAATANGSNEYADNEGAPSYATVPASVYQVAGADDDITVALWLKLPSSDPVALNPVYSHVDDTDDTPYFRLMINASAGLDAQANGASGTSTATVPLAGKWGENHLYAMRWDGSADLMEAWEDGVFVDRDVTVIGSDAGSAMDDGRVAGFGSTVFVYTLGIDEVVVFDRRLTREEMYQLGLAGLGAQNSGSAAVTQPMQTAAGTGNQFGAFVSQPMQAVVAVASFHASVAATQPMHAVAVNAGVVVAAAQPMHEVDALGHAVPLNAVVQPMHAVAAHAGADAAVEQPAQAVAVAATVGNVAVAALEQPVQTVVATATQDVVGGVAATQPMQTVVALAGAVARVGSPLLAVAAAATQDNLASAAVVLPMQVAAAAGSTDNLATVAVVQPMHAVASISNRIAVVLPMQLIAATGRALSAVYDTFVMNVKTGAVTQYDHWNFDSIVRLGGQYIGFNATGAYVVGGTTAAGTAFDAAFRTGRLRFGSNDLKRPYRAYLTHKPGGDVLFTVFKDGAQRAVHRLVDPGVTALVEKRVKMSRGAKEKGKFWAFELASDAGGGLEIDAVQVLAQKLGRRFR